MDPDQTPQNAASGHDLQFANSKQHSERKLTGPIDEVGYCIWLKWVVLKQ